MQTSSWERTFADFKTTYANLLNNSERPLDLQQKLYIILAGEHAKVDYAYKSDGFLYVHMLMWDRKIIARRTNVTFGSHSWALLNNVLGKRPMECLYPYPEDYDDIECDLLRAFVLIGKKGEDWVDKYGINGLKTHRVVWTTTTSSGTVTSIRTVYTLKERELPEASLDRPEGDKVSRGKKRRSEGLEGMLEEAVDELLGNKATPWEDQVWGADSETKKLVVMKRRK